jgi:predicted RNA-binding protein
MTQIAQKDEATLVRIENEEHLNERQFIIELAFKPLVPNLKLRPQESQLLLAYIGEILKEIEEEERRIVEKE